MPNWLRNYFNREYDSPLDEDVLEFNKATNNLIYYFASLLSNKIKQPRIISIDLIKKSIFKHVKQIEFGIGIGEWSYILSSGLKDHLVAIDNIDSDKIILELVGELTKSQSLLTLVSL